jgi:membrane-bound lytic murein transglycosylase B
MIRRRLLALSSLALLSACASSVPPPPPPGGYSPTTPPAYPPQSQPVQPTPAQPRPPASTVSTSEMEFDAWRRDFLENRAGRWRSVLERELAGVTPEARVLTQDLGQPEFSVPVSTYLTRTVSADRIARGRQARDGVPRLGEIERQYGVPAEILTGIWGLETAYGQIMGNQDVVRSLATLAAQGRRRPWAEAQLMAAAQMISEGAATRSQLRGSWAGAMGHTQFIPETYLSRAVDGDGDGTARHLELTGRRTGLRGQTCSRTPAGARAAAGRSR